jgi:hypothetical protein
VAAPDRPFSPDRVLDVPPSPFPANWTAYIETLGAEWAGILVGPLRRALITPCLTMPLVLLAALDRLGPGGLARYAEPGGPTSLVVHLIGAEMRTEIDRAAHTVRGVLRFCPRRVS